MTLPIYADGRRLQWQCGCRQNGGVLVQPVAPGPLDPDAVSSERLHELAKAISNEVLHLWEVDHPYYCNEGNFFAGAEDDCHNHYPRWQDFIASEGDADLDMNLVFRFDWKAPRRNGDFENPIVWQGDEYYRDSTLKLFFVGQRKGIYRWVTIEVCRADEPAVREWLQIRWDHLRLLWRPLSYRSVPSGT